MSPTATKIKRISSRAAYHKERTAKPLSQLQGVLSLCGSSRPGYLTFGETIPNLYSLYNEPTTRLNFIESLIFDKTSEIDADSWNVLQFNK
jgi:hypothetical protein